MTVKAFVNLSTRQKFFFIYKLFSAQYPICLFFFLKSYKISLPVAEDAALAVAEVDAANVAGEVGGGVVKKSPKFAYVVYEWPLTLKHDS